MDFYSATSLIQQCVGRHIVPLGHIIIIPTQQVFALPPWCRVSIKEAAYNYINCSLWFDRTHVLPHSRRECKLFHHRCGSTAMQIVFVLYLSHWESRNEENWVMIKITGLIPPHVYQNTCLPEHIFTRTHIHQNTCLPEHIFTRTHIYQNTCLPEHIFTRTHVYQNTYLPEHMFTRTHVYQNTYLPEHMFTRTHISIRLCRCLLCVTMLKAIRRLIPVEIFFWLLLCFITMPFALYRICLIWFLI